MGMMLSENFIFYLVDENGKPYWYLSRLFQVSDNKISQNWYFRNFSKDEGVEIEAIWGYSELCNQEGYFDRLMDRDDEAMRIYFRKKMDAETE